MEFYLVTPSQVLTVRVSLSGGCDITAGSALITAPASPVPHYFTLPAPPGQEKHSPVQESPPTQR